MKTASKLLLLNSPSAIEFWISGRRSFLVVIHRSVFVSKNSHAPVTQEKDVADKGPPSVQIWSKSCAEGRTNTDAHAWCKHTNISHTSQNVLGPSRWPGRATQGGPRFQEHTDRSKSGERSVAPICQLDQMPRDHPKLLPECINTRSEKMYAVFNGLATC